MLSFDDHIDWMDAAHLLAPDALDMGAYVRTQNAWHDPRILSSLTIGD